MLEAIKNKMNIGQAKASSAELRERLAQLEGDEAAAGAKLAAAQSTERDRKQAVAEAEQAFIGGRTDAAFLDRARKELATASSAVASTENELTNARNLVEKARALLRDSERQDALAENREVLSRHRDWRRRFTDSLIATCELRAEGLAIEAEISQRCPELMDTLIRQIASGGSFFRVNAKAVGNFDRSALLFWLRSMEQISPAELSDAANAILAAEPETPNRADTTAEDEQRREFEREFLNRQGPVFTVDADRTMRRVTVAV